MYERGKVRKNRSLIYLSERKSKFDASKWEVLKIGGYLQKWPNIRGVSEVPPKFNKIWLIV
jgi:hypothetical protein